MHLLLLEAMPPEAGKMVTESLSIPVYGIGAGPHTDGQLLIIHDVLGLFQAFTPRFAKRFLEGGALIKQALMEYTKEVREKTFPSKKYWYE